MGTLLLIIDSYFGHCPSVWVWCFLLIPFRFCIFGWNSTEGGLSSAPCLLSDGGRFPFVPLPVLFTLIIDSSSFCQASLLRSVVMSRPGSCFETIRFYLTFRLFSHVIGGSQRPILCSRLSSFIIICFDAHIAPGLASGSPLRSAPVSLSDMFPLFV